MDNTMTLKKVLSKAMENGYEPNEGVAYFQCEDDQGNCYSEHGNYLLSYKLCKILCETGVYKNTQLITVSSNYFQLIFNHDFAKAFWGETSTVCGCDVGEPAWEFYLQQMVLEEDPVNYLEKFL